MADKWFSVLRALFSLLRICTLYYVGQNRASFAVEQSNRQMILFGAEFGLKRAMICAIDRL